MKVDIYNKNAEKQESLDLPKEIFSIDWNPDLVHKVVTAHRSNKRQGSAHTKERGDVRGGGKKPWRQKGTGRARHGSIRSPIWRGGGVTFGPRNERNYSKKINKKAKRKALVSVLSKKLQDEEIRIIDSLSLSDNKTKEVRDMIKKFFNEDKKSGSMLFIPTSDNSNFKKAARNISGVEAQSPLSLNAFDCLSFKYIFIDKAALQEISDHYGPSADKNNYSEENKNKSDNKKKVIKSV